MLGIEIFEEMPPPDAGWRTGGEGELRDVRGTTKKVASRIDNDDGAGRTSLRSVA